MRCLWVSGDVPQPPNSGLTVYSAHLSEALASHAHVEGLGLAPASVAPARGSSQVIWHGVAAHRRSAQQGLLSPLPHMAAAAAARPVQEELRRLLKASSWDAVILDHLQVGWALGEVLRWREGPGNHGVLVHVSHNHETSVRAGAARREAAFTPKGLVLRYDAAKIARLERRVVQACDVLTAITERDQRAFADLRSTTPVILPPGYDGSVVDARDIDATVPRRVLVLGHWEWHVKQRNIEAFLRVADPLFAQAHAEILIAGPAPARWVDSLAPQLTATRFSGWVDDLDSVLATARLGVVSEPAGGGFKLKSLDYVFRRLPMAVLAGSMEGLPLRPGVDYVSATSEQDLAEAALGTLDDLDTLNTMQESAFLRCAPLRGWSRQGAELFQAIGDALGTRPGRGVARTG